MTYLYQGIKQYPAISLYCILYIIYYYLLYCILDSELKYQPVAIWPKNLPWNNHLNQHKEDAWWKSRIQNDPVSCSETSVVVISLSQKLHFFYFTSQVSDITNEILVPIWLSELRLLPEEMSQRSKKLKLILFSIYL